MLLSPSPEQFPHKIMAPNFVKRLWSKAPKRNSHRAPGSCTPQTTQTASATSESVSDGNQPQTQIPIPAAPQPVSSAAEPPRQAPPDATTTPTSLPRQLWTQAYDAIKQDDPKLVGAYEIVLRRELGGESSPADNLWSEDDQMDDEQIRTQILHLVEAGLKKTNKEAAVNHKIQEGMRVVSSVRELAGTAVKHAPEAAAAWGGVCLLLQVLENPIDEASANRDGMAYVASRMEWYWNLSSLVLEKNHKGPAGLGGQLEKNLVNLYEKLLSYQMRSVCSCYRSPTTKLFRNVVRFDDWAGAVQSIKDAEKVVQLDIDSFSVQDIRKSLKNIAERAKSQCAQLQGINQNLQDMRQEIQESAKKQEERWQFDNNRSCLSALRLTDPRDDKKRIEDTKGGLFLGASRWVLDHDDFRQWRDCDDVRLLWIKGDPGKGKTMLLITIVDELERRLKESEQQKPPVLSYFFCQGSNNDLNNATAVLRGIIYLVAVQYPPLVSHLRRRYDHAGSEVFQDANSFFALSEVLKSMLGDKSLTKAYLVVDALDECVADRERLLKLISDHAAALPHVKWIISSRNKREIEQHIKIDGLGMKLSLEISQNAEQVSRAVDAYVDLKVSELQSLQDDYDLRHRIRKTLQKKANDTFLWVALVVQELHRTNSWDMEEVIEEIPAELEGLYDRMMQQIQKLKKRNSEFCCVVLGIITAAYRPLYTAELGILSGLPRKIASNTNAIREIIALCGSFLTVKDGFVYVIHQSVKDYLSDKASGTIFPNGLSQTHRAIFSQSVQALSARPLRRNIYCLSHPGMLLGEVETPNPDPLAGIQYSCVYWANHFCDIYLENSQFRDEDTQQDTETIYQFIEKHFLYWLETVAHLRSMSDGIASIRRLDSLLKVSMMSLNTLDSGFS